MPGDYTPRQGQCLAFIYYYTKLHGQPPAESDMQRYVKVSDPAVHRFKRGGVTRISSPLPEVQKIIDHIERREMEITTSLS